MFQGLNVTFAAFRDFRVILCLMFYAKVIVRCWENSAASTSTKFHSFIQSSSCMSIWIRNATSTSWKVLFILLDSWDYRLTSIWLPSRSWFNQEKTFCIFAWHRDSTDCLILKNCSISAEWSHTTLWILLSTHACEPLLEISVFGRLSYQHNRTNFEQIFLDIMASVLCNI